MKTSQLIIFHFTIMVPVTALFWFIVMLYWRSLRSEIAREMDYVRARISHLENELGIKPFDEGSNPQWRHG